MCLVDLISVLRLHSILWHDSEHVECKEESLFVFSQNLLPSGLIGRLFNWHDVSNVKQLLPFQFLTSQDFLSHSFSSKTELSYCMHSFSTYGLYFILDLFFDTVFIPSENLFLTCRIYKLYLIVQLFHIYVPFLSYYFHCAYFFPVTHYVSLGLISCVPMRFLFFVGSMQQYVSMTLLPLAGDIKVDSWVSKMHFKCRKEQTVVCSLTEKFSHKPFLCFV